MISKIYKVNVKWHRINKKHLLAINLVKLNKLYEKIPISLCTNY